MKPRAGTLAHSIFALRGGKGLNVLRTLADKDVRAPIERLGVILVALHFVVSVVHGAAHLDLHIDLKTWQTIYVLLVISALPLVSGFLLWRRARNGFLLLLFSMLGSLIFGGYYHFIATGADNVASLGLHAWSAPFQV